LGFQYVQEEETFFSSCPFVKSLLKRFFVFFSFSFLAWEKKKRIESVDESKKKKKKTHWNTETDEIEVTVMSFLLF
jgi:hypothetical protein